MFAGRFQWHDKDICVTHSGYYYHAYSKDIDFPQATEHEYSEFDALYVSICKKLEKLGYELIEEEQSEAHFEELCKLNNWTFTKEGEMENE